MNHRVILAGLLMAVPLGAGCIAPSLRLKPPYDWSQDGDRYALNARVGRFYYPYGRVLEAAERMLEDKQFTIQALPHPSGDGVLLRTDPWDESGVADFQLEGDLRRMGSYVQVRWTLYSYRGTITTSSTAVVWGTRRERTSDDPDFVRETNERWNYQLYEKITAPGRRHPSGESVP